MTEIGENVIELELPELRPECWQNDEENKQFFFLLIKDILRGFDLGKWHLLRPRTGGMWKENSGPVHLVMNELFFVLQGGCSYQFPEEQIDAGAGSLVMVSSGMPHLEYPDNRTGKRFASLVLIVGDNQAWIHLAGCHTGKDLQICCCVNLPDAIFYHRLTDSLSFVPYEPEEIRIHLVKSLLLKLAADIEEMLQPFERSEQFRSAIASGAKRIIDENIPGRFFSVQELAGMLECSSNHLSAVFSRAYGVTISEYVSDLRLKHAKELLARSRFSISDIAGKCGYNDASYFSRCFRKRYGVSPSQMR